MDPGTEGTAVGEIAIVAIVGFIAAAINGVVGSGTLISYPVLLSLGLSPVTANGTNSVGLSPGGVASAWAYRGELKDRWRILAVPTVLAMAGGLIGALLVVSLPAKVFTAIVPWLIIMAVVLVAVQPLMMKALRRRKNHVVRPGRDLPAWTFFLGIYAGYFGAAQGVMYYGVLGLRYDEDLQHVNAAKNLMGSLANLMGALVFAFSGLVSWELAAALWLGSILGGYYGGRFAKRIPAPYLRALIMAVGLLAVLLLWLRR